MKRTAKSLILLAGLSGGCTTTDTAKPTGPGGFGTVTRVREVPGVQGPTGEPIGTTAARSQMPTGPSGGVKQAGYSGTMSDALGVQQASGIFRKGAAAADCGTCSVPGVYGGNVAHGASYVPVPYDGPRNGILPVPGQGAPGAVAAIGAYGPGMGVQAQSNMRTSIKFTGPAGMKISWQVAGGGFTDEAAALTAPAEYNFMQAQIYRLRLSKILPNYAGKTFYPTIEVSPASIKTLKFLAHTSVPVTFTNEDFEQASAGNMVVKVIYLPDAQFQDFATVAGAEEIVSTRLEPGADPIAEAQKRGTVLAVITMGNIDLENRASPAMNAPPGMMMAPPPGAMMAPPGALAGTSRVTGGPVAPTGPAPVVSGPSTTVRPSTTGGPVSPGALPPSVGNTGTRPTSLPAFNR
jgi:hypothetical protein